MSYRYSMGAQIVVSGDTLRGSSAVLEHAAANRQKLSQRDREFLVALQHRYKSEHAEAERRLREIVRAYPDDWHGLYMLSEVLSWTGNLTGNDFSEAVALARRCLQIFPNYEIAYGTLNAEANMNPDKNVMLDVLEKRVSLFPNSDFAPLSRVLHVYLEQDPASIAAVQETLKNLIPFHTLVIAIQVARLNSDYATAEKLMRRLLDPAVAPAWYPETYLGLACLKVRQGKWREARAFFQHSYKLPVYIALHEFAPLTVQSEGLLDSLDMEFRQFKDPGWSPTSVMAEHNYSLAHIDLARDDLESALIRADSLAMARDEEPNEILRIFFSNYYHNVLAHVYFRTGDLRAALQELEQLSIEKWTWISVGSTSALRSMCSERYLRAQVLRGLGRYEEALRWLRYLGETAGGFGYAAQKHHLTAEVYEEMGNTEKAIEHYEKFVELWQDCDPELRHHVDDARERIARLRSKLTHRL